MLPFLSEAVEKIMRRLMNMFVKEEVLEEANTAYKLIKLDVSKKRKPFSSTVVVQQQSIFLSQTTCQLTRSYNLKSLV